MEISVSYSRKLSHELYGGNSFENSDHFCSLRTTIDDEQDPKEAHAELAQIAKELVDARVEEEIMGFQGGIPYDQFKQFIYDYVANRLKDVEVFDTTRAKMSKHQRDMVDTIRRGRTMAVNDRKKELAKV